MFPLQVMNLIGDVKGKVAIMVDDMIDTAGMPSSMHNLTFEQIFHFSFLYSVFFAGSKKSNYENNYLSFIY
jgi:phosphoribosylpyrophosphate synthetase